MKKTDLHIHSKYSSDGEFETQEIIEMCVSNEVETFSITDHNSVSGIENAVLQSQSKGLSFIPGIEIDCNYKGIDLHLLGYNINWKSRDFKNVENSVAEKVMNSLTEMIYNLQKLGFTINEEAVLSKANGSLPTGELIAEVMLSDKKYETDRLRPYMSGGSRSDMPYINFYHDYFAQGKPAHVHIEFMSFTDAIKLVIDNGGIPVIAHPGLNLKGKEEITEQLLGEGAKGIEVFNNYHNDQQIEYFVDLVKKRNTLMTCGSDFHGKTKPLIHVGHYKFKKQYNDYLSNSIAVLKQKIKPLS